MLRDALLRSAPQHEAGKAQHREAGKARPHLVPLHLSNSPVVLAARHRPRHSAEARANKKVRGRAGRRGPADPRGPDLSRGLSGTAVSTTPPSGLGNPQVRLSSTSRARCLRLAPQDPRWARVTFPMPGFVLRRELRSSPRHLTHRFGAGRCRLSFGGSPAASAAKAPVTRGSRAGTLRLGPPKRGVRLAPLDWHTPATAPRPAPA
jgi:hypothetical protein